MLRAIGAVVLGYVAMAAIVFVSFAVAYLAMGAEGAFQPESYEVSRLWLVVWFVGSLAAAVAGGWVCAAVAKSAKPVVALAVLVLMLGAIQATCELALPRDTPTTRSGDVGNFEAMTNARMPPWVAITTPLLGFVGTLLGGRLKRAACCGTASCASKTPAELHGGQA
jgi:hypothetical protein